MTVSAIATSIIEALTSGLTGIITQVPQAIANSFTALFMTGSGENQTLSTMAIVLLVFGGISLAFGLTKLVFHLVRSKVG